MSTPQQARNNIYMYTQVPFSMFVIWNIMQDERRPMVARMWYCDIGEKGNVPNWAAREKLLEHFLVGGKPLPGRVHGVSPLSPSFHEHSMGNVLGAFMRRRIPS